MKNILGLDIGTNSIGWAVVQMNEQGKLVFILKAGSRIIPMGQDMIGDFNKGNTVSSTAERTAFRSIRRIRERHLLRRERLHRVLRTLGFLPSHYVDSIGWDKSDNRTYGKFLPDTEPKLPWRVDENGKPRFLFVDSFQEMLNDFREHQPELFQLKEYDVPLPIPYDWTIYYLRKKALSAPISREELAWILLNFNRKRGYYQLRGEEEELKSKQEEYHCLTIVNVEPKGEKDKKGKQIYQVTFDNGWIDERASGESPQALIGLKQEYIITTFLDADGEPKLDKEANIIRKFRVADEEDWTLQKKKTENDLMASGKTVGAYIYDTLLSQPNQKIRGKLIRTIERQFYKAELDAILRKQREFIPELTNDNLLSTCIEELYPHNIAHQENLRGKDLKWLLIEDIIFYQRPLKSQKHLITNCPYEKRIYKKEGIKHFQSLKCTPRSNPVFQEFRLWQFIHNLRIYKRQEWVDGKLQTDVDVTSEMLPDHYKAELFDFLNKVGSIKQDTLLKKFLKVKNEPGEKTLPYRWNYMEDKSYPCNETRASLLQTIKKAGIKPEFLTPQVEKDLWHLLYSIDDPCELRKGLQRFAERHQLPDTFTEEFSKFPPFKKEYASYSEKAIRKLLALMRLGKYREPVAIDPKTYIRIEKILSGEVDESISTSVREKCSGFTSIEDFLGIPLYFACYVVYNRHSESSNLTRWHTPEELQHYMQYEFKQHSLRNPIVEQVVRETMCVVQDIWQSFGQIDEIHLELGREMKLPADKRAAMTQRMQENENRNLRIRALLRELKNDYAIENVSPYSPSHQEKLKIYEEGVLLSVRDIPEDIMRISRMAEPGFSELQRYKLWLEQKYCSPYTGNPIPLGKLFTTEYQVEHIIPQACYFDDSLSNKVICESEVNKLKDNQLAYEFIRNHGGTIAEGNFRKQIRLFTLEEYQQFVQTHYSRNREKMKKLLLEEIPKSFIERQMNDTRHISRVIKGLLSCVVRDPDETAGDSRHLIFCNGKVTSELKRDWGLNDVWDRIIQPRFERLNDLLGTSDFGEWKGNRFRIQVPAGVQKKRIDHRHHALDAIVIACATRNHINYLGNMYARDKKQRYDLRNKLCRLEEVEYDRIKNGVTVREKGCVAVGFLKPWETFTSDVQHILEHIVVSFKQNIRILNKTTNYTACFDAEGNRSYQKQVKGDRLSVRKPLHKDTAYGRVTLQEKETVKLAVGLENPSQLVDRGLKAKIRELEKSYGKYDLQQILFWFKSRKFDWNGQNVSKVERYRMNDQYVAKRESLGAKFKQDEIDTVTDSGIRNILTAHLKCHGGNAETAFSQAGIAEMNRNICALNGGKPHQPIYKVRLRKAFGKMYPVGYTRNKKHRFVKAAKDTNLYFAVYRSEEGKRNYETIGLNVVAERLKQGDTPVPKSRLNGDKEDMLLFWLSPNDLVYLPIPEEQENPHLVDFSQLNKEQVKRVYKMVSCTESRCYFIPVAVAIAIVDKKEYNSINKIEISQEGISIKEFCWKLRTDRLGNIIAVQR